MILRAALPMLLLAAVAGAGPSGLLLHGYLARAGLGYSPSADKADIWFETLPVGAGWLFNGDVAVAVGTKLAEGGIETFDDPNAGRLPVYGYVLHPLRLSRFNTATAYAYAGTCQWSDVPLLGATLNYWRFGMGVQGTFWAVTPGVEVSYRFYNDGYPAPIWALQFTLGVGGWYPLFDTRGQD